MASVAQTFFRMFRGPAAAEAASESAAGPLARRSSGWAELMKSIKGQENLSVLDLGPTSPRNIAYFTAGANRMYSEDVLLASLNPEYVTKNDEGAPTNDVARFLAENLSF